MKKIMKKALSLMLALVMMFSLAPMTASAADDPAVYSDGSTEVLNLLDGTVWRDFDPTESGTLTITIESLSGSAALTVTDYSDNSNPVRSQLVAGASFTFDYVAGRAYEFAFECLNYDATECAVAYSIELEVGDGEGAGGSSTAGTTEFDPINLELDENGTGSVEVAKNSTVYYAVPVQPGTNYTLKVKAGPMGAFSLTVGGEVVAAETADASFDFTPRSYSLVFALTGVGNNPYIDIMLTEAVANTTGTYENPAELVLNQFNEVTLGSSQPSNVYYYTWTAAVDGKLTIAPFDMMCTGGWTYSVSGGDAEGIFYSSSDETVVNPGEYVVKEGETISVWVATSEYTAGTVVFKAMFEEGSFGKEDDEEQEEITFSEEAENAALSSELLQLGEDSYVTSLYEYTVYSFEPVSTGVYTITSENALLGIVSYNGMWIQDGYEPSAETVASNEIVWECSSVGQSIWVAVKTNDDVANINVAWDELVVEEIESENAYPTVSLETYTFDGDLDKLESLMYGLADEKVDFALGEDGFFHVADVKDFDENGDYIGKKPLEELPVVLVKLNDSVVSLQSAIGYGNVKYVEYGEDEDGNPVAVSILYFNDMLTEYLSYAATDAKLYPLTEDLLYTMILVGADQGWYVEDGAVEYAFQSDGVPADLLYTFAMYYLEPEKEPVKVEVPADKVIAESALGTAIQEAIKNDTPLVVETTTEGVTLTFAPADLKDAEAVKLNVEVKLDVDVKDETVAKNDDITADNFVLKVEFSHDGKLPAKATITIPVPAKFANKTLFYYEILADGTLKFVCDAPVDANGNAKVTQDHCSDYVLLSEKIVEELPEAPKTGDTTNFALWIAILGLGVVAIAGSVVMKKREF